MARNPELETLLATDSRCCGCENVVIVNVDVEPLTEDELHFGSTVFTECKHCGEEKPHNIVRFLSGLNRGRGTTEYEP